jgi:hypothetical protein
LQTVRFTLNSPGVRYVWTGCCSDDVVPSPKSQDQVENVPVDVSVKFTVSGAYPALGLPSKFTMGGGVGVGAGVTGGEGVGLGVPVGVGVGIGVAGVSERWISRFIPLTEKPLWK